MAESQDRHDESYSEARLNKLVEVGLALAAEKDLRRLLDLVVEESRAITHADAGTLYIVDDEKRELRFEVLHNDSMETHLNRAADEAQVLPNVPLYIDGEPNKSNVSSYVAVTGESLNIPDVYEATGFNFEGTRRYDETSGYRSKSMMLVVLRNHQDKHIGVLQLINAQDPATGEVVAFSDDDLSIISAFASQAAMALTNAYLIEDLSNEIERTRALEEAEKELNQKLRDAYMDLEESNLELTDALGRIQTGRRIAAIAAGVIAVLMTAYLFWPGSSLVDSVSDSDSSASYADDTRTVEVRRTPVVSTLSLVGSLAPIEVVNVTGPFNGTVASKQFNYGQVVSEGDLLVRLDTKQLEIDLRNARTAYLNAAERAEDLANWEESSEVSRARRSLSRATMAYDRQKQVVGETRLLLDKGIVAESEYINATTQEAASEMDWLAAKEELAAVMDKGSEKNREIAEFELKNARLKVEEFEQHLANAAVYAPVSGTILHPAKPEEAVQRGSPVKQGELLISIGNLAGLSVNTNVNETEVNHIRAGQRVNVTGDAFPGKVFVGRVAHVTSQAKSDAQGNPGFGITVVVDEFDSEHHKDVRLGMSANLEIVVYEKPDALVLPLYAVRTDGASSVVRVHDEESDEFVDVDVVTGFTTIDSVEILSGVREGDVVAF